MCSPSIPDTSPTQEKAIELQGRIADKNLALQDQMFQYFKDRQDQIDPLQQQVQKQQMDIAAETQAQGSDLYNYQKEVFRPVEESLVNQAMQDSTPAYYEKYAQEAATRIAAGQQNAQDQFDRSMSSMGVNPNSGAYAAGRRGMQLDQAAQLGAGMNDARDRAEALGWARRADVAGLGKGLVGAGNASYGLATGAGSSALSGAESATQTAAGTMGTATQYGQMGTTAGNNMGNLANDIYKAQAGASGGDDGSGAAIGAVGMVAAAFI